MKKVYSILSACALALAVNAQQQNITRTPGHAAGNLQAPPVLPQTVTDTLGGFSWTQSTTTPTYYGSADANGNGNGYLSGTNGWGDLEKGQQFVPAQGMMVEGALYWFVYKSYASNNANSKVVAKAYYMNGTTGTTSTVNGTAPCPGSVITSYDIPMSTLDTSLSFSGMQMVMWPTAFYAASDFVISFDMSSQDVANGDSVACVTSTDGDAAGTEQSWEKWSDNSWHTMMQAWSGLDIDLAIFALVDLSSSTNNIAAMNGATLGFQGANPFVNNTTIAYSFDKNVSNAKLMIVDANGKVVKEEQLGNKAAGSYTYDVNGTDLAAGTYFVMLQGGDAKIAVKMVKQ
jgi:hypothetical protein